MSYRIKPSGGVLLGFFLALSLPQAAAAQDGGPIALKVTGPGGQAQPMVIVSRSNRSRSKNYRYNTRYYTDQDDVWWNIVHWGIPHAPNQVGEKLPTGTPNACAAAVVAANPDCGTVAWTEACVKATKKLCRNGALKKYAKVAYGEPICGLDKKGKQPEAIFLSGDWDGNSGTQGAGGKITTDPNAISIGCRGVGATAKCVDMGYKPWVSPEMDLMHQACVRMVRADFCGDGTPWTVDGNVIDISDAYGIETSESKGWVFEAMWTKDGASYMNPALDFRTEKWASHIVNPHVGMTFAEYQKTHPYCQPKLVTQLEASTTPGVYGLADMTFNKTDRALRTLRPAECPATNSGTCKQGL